MKQRHQFHGAMHNQIPGKRPFPVDEFHIGIHPGILGIIQREQDLFEGSRHVIIICIEPANDLSAGQGKSFIEGITLPFVRFGDKDDMGISPSNLSSFVGRTIVNNYVLKRRERLVLDTLDRLLDVFTLIEGGGDD